MDALEMLRELDERDAANLSKQTPVEGYRMSSKPEWKRAQSKARKRQATEVIVIDDSPVMAHQPKKAKKISQTPRRRTTTSRLTDVIAALSSEMERLEEMIAKVLEQNKQCNTETERKS
ncbi:hypothetical protein FGB62_37g48 [Gracilaria domingensis]|nr:hypothetical protein FGB62_37g48 [Gracilaria domingensis]